MQGRPPAPAMLHRKIPYMTWPDTSRKPGFTAGAGHALERRVRGRMATGRGVFMNGAEGPPDRGSGGLDVLPRAAVSTGAECVLSKVSGRAGKDIIHRRIRSPCVPFEGSAARDHAHHRRRSAVGIGRGRCWRFVCSTTGAAARTGRNPQVTAKGRGKHVRAAARATGMPWPGAASIPRRWRHWRGLRDRGAARLVRGLAGAVGAVARVWSIHDSTSA